MDPLSICASVVQLSVLSANVAKLLTSITKSAINAEAHISSLNSEVATLTSLLSCVNKTLSGCKSRSHALDLVEDNLWQQSEVALQDCDAVLSNLASFAASIKAKQKRKLWKARVGIDLSIHNRKLEQFRTSLRRSNCALQTVLHTITLSLAIQNNTSQTLVLAALDKLKCSIDDALWMAARPATIRPQGNCATFDIITSKNLQSLAKAAQSFYSSASSAAGSSVGSSAATEWTPLAKDAACSVSGLDSLQAERVHNYIYDSNDLDMREPPPTDELNFVRTDASRLSEESTTLYDLDLQLPLTEVLEDFALEKMKENDFAAAVSFLEQASSGELGSCSAPDIYIRLQTRLAICHLFQGSRPKCEAVIKRVEHLGGMLDLEVLNLLHAVAMSYLSDGRFDEASEACTRALRAKMRLLGKSHPETLQTLGLLARIYDEFDEVIHLEATRRMMPRGFVYSNPRSERDFLTAHSSLIPDNYSSCRPAELEDITVLPVYELPAGDLEHIPRHGGLQGTLSRYEKLQADTMKEVVVFETTSLRDESIDTFQNLPSTVPKRSLSQSMALRIQHSSLRRNLSQLVRSKSQSHSEDSLKLAKSRTVLQKRCNSTGSGMANNCRRNLTRLRSLFGTWGGRNANTGYGGRSQLEPDDSQGVNEIDSTPLGVTSRPVQHLTQILNDVLVDAMCQSSQSSQSSMPDSIVPTAKDNGERLPCCEAILSRSSSTSQTAGRSVEGMFDGPSRSSSYRSCHSSPKNVPPTPTSVLPISHSQSSMKNSVPLTAKDSGERLPRCVASLSRSSSTSQSSISSVESVFDTSTRSSSYRSYYSPRDVCPPPTSVLPTSHETHRTTDDDNFRMQCYPAAICCSLLDAACTYKPDTQQCAPPNYSEDKPVRPPCKPSRARSQMLRERKPPKYLMRALSWSKGDDAGYQISSATQVTEDQN
jgi:hypothetical protein